MLPWQRLVLTLLCGPGLISLAFPALGADNGRIIIDLPLPATALEGSASQAPPTETLASLAPPRRAVSTLEPPVLRQFQEHYRLAPGQSLYQLFKRHDLRQGELAQMLGISRQAQRVLSRLRPGQQINLWLNSERNIQTLVIGTRGSREYRFSKTPSGYRYTEQTVPVTVAAVTPAPPDSPAQPDSRSSAAAPAGPQPSARSIKVRVKPGDSLYLIFKRQGISGGDLAELMATDGAKTLKRLRPGQQLELGISADAALAALRLQIDEVRTLRAQRTADGFQLNTSIRPLDRRISNASATIESSLFLAGQRAGLSDPLIMQMVEIFGWDIDFALDIRAGDRFTLIYEELYRDGKKLRDGRILAAEFFNRGRSLRALRYQDANGRVAYYSPEGLSMRKAFIRTPVSYARISSRFNLRRKHPVLNRIRAHRGVDYAAPRGTPIKAAGDGRVIFAGRKSGYGKTVILKHGGKYSTLYGHMSRLHKRARRGKRVLQGQIIGYVGQTGLATGPHLHYEFRIRGVHKDPLRVKLPKALPIERRYRANFLASSKSLVARLDHLASTSLASNP